MVAWYWLIVAFVGGLVFATITWNAVECDNVVSVALAWIAIPFVWIAMFPILFFGWYFKPISPEKWAEYRDTFGNGKYWKISKNTYLWHDPNAKKLYNKFFLIRVKKA